MIEPYPSDLEEVTVWAGHKVWAKVGDNNTLIFGDPQGILSQPLRPYPIYFLNIIIINVLIA
jgi:hypothetical protein